MGTVESYGRPMAAGGVDWGTHWRAKVEARQRQAARTQNPEETADPHARYGARLAFDAPADDPLRVALSEALQGGGTLLDIGAGAGRYAVPLARIATHVTAVEPSPFMRGALTRRLQEAGVDNVSIVPEPWPEADVAIHDVSLCSHAMFSAPDVEAFVSKLDRCGRRACLLAVRVDQRTAPFDQLYPEIVGEPWAPEPDFLDLYGALFAMGIRAHVQIVPWGRSYPTLDEVVEDARRQLGLNLQEHTHDARLGEFAREATVERDGRVEFKVPRHAAIIWWDKQG